MTGTGTQSDPYIPTALTEFITAVGTAGAYVALTQDINAADDPAYTGELTSVITVNAAEVDGQEHTITGVIVRAKNMMNLYATGCTVKNISFRDWSHQRTEVGTTMNGTSNRRETFENCIFSMTANAASSWQKLFSLLNFKNCAIDVTCTGVGSRDLMELDRFERSTVLIRGYAASSLCKQITLTRSAIIFDGGNLIASGIFSSLQGQYSYIAKTKKSDSTIRFGDGTTTGCVFAVAEGQATSSVPSGTTVGTLDQMKDKDWLTSVGFLP